jgi:hypothetical protein
MKAPGAWRSGWRRWRVPAAILLAVAVVTLSGIRSWPDQIRGMRPPNNTDEFYRYVAQQLNEPVLCEKIPWSVESPGGFLASPSYERSECYDFIAGRTKNPSICWKVKRLGAFSVLSTQTSLWSCLDHAFHGWNGGMAISQEGLVQFFARIGYEPDTIHLEGITPPVVSLKDNYRQLMTQPDLVARIEKTSTSFDKTSNLSARDIANYSYLFDAAALVTTDFKWCSRIPGDVAVASEPWKFRDWCLFTLATNTKSSELCLRLPATGPNGMDPRMSLRGQCNFHVNSTIPSNTRYGPEVPDDDERIRELITMLNYEIPRAKDLPPEEIYAAYDRFLDELNNRTDPTHIAARRRFIERVQRLPKNN